MATQRYISTKFWEDMWIRSLDPSERYLYMYLLTNPLTNIAGIYQITIDRIAFDTGYDERTLEPMIERFADAGKAYFYQGEWMILPTWPKHQRVGVRDNCRKGIDTILKGLSDEIFNQAIAFGYNYKYLKEIGRPLQAPSSPLQGDSTPLNYLDSDINSDTDTDTDSDTKAVPINKTQSIVWKSEPALSKAAWISFENHYGTFMPDHTKQIDAMNRLVFLASERGDPEIIITGMMKKLLELKTDDDSKKGFWRDQPYLPSTLAALWAHVWESAKMESINDDLDWDSL